MDCPAILKMSRPETPGLEEGDEGGTSIDSPFSKTTRKTIRSGFLCVQHITGVGTRLYRGYGSPVCSRFPVVVRGLVSRLFEDQCQLPSNPCIEGRIAFSPINARLLYSAIQALQVDYRIPHDCSHCHLEINV